MHYGSALAHRMYSKNCSITVAVSRRSCTVHLSVTRIHRKFSSPRLRPIVYYWLKSSQVLKLLLHAFRHMQSFRLTDLKCIYWSLYTNTSPLKAKALQAFSYTRHSPLSIHDNACFWFLYFASLCMNYEELDQAISWRSSSSALPGSLTWSLWFPLFNLFSSKADLHTMIWWWTWQALGLLARWTYVLLSRRGEGQKKEKEKTKTWCLVKHKQQTSPFPDRSLLGRTGTEWQAG